MNTRNHRSWSPISLGVLLAITVAGWSTTARAGTTLDSGDEAPVFMLFSYNEEISTEAAGTTSPSLGNFLGVSPEKPRDAVLLVFLGANSDTAADLELLAKIQRKYASWGRGLQVLAVCVDAREGNINDTLAVAKGVNFPVLRDRFLVAADRYGVRRTDVPVSFLLVGERPNAHLTPSEQAAIKGAYLDGAYNWTVRIVSRWSGGLVAQEMDLGQGIESVLTP